MVGQKTISSNLEPICGCQPSIKKKTTAERDTIDFIRQRNNRVLY
jgi:hypothetical protein